MNVTPPVLCLVTDRRRLAERLGWGASERRTLTALVEQAVAASHAGVDIVQIREADLSGALLSELARAIRAESPPACRVVVNDRLDVAVVAADGVHLKESSLSPRAARGLLGPSRIIGWSAHDARSIAAASDDVDYVIFGSVFQTPSKPEGWPIAGLAGLARAVAAAGRRPVLAIGGVGPANASQVRAAGAAGLAGIDAFLPSGASALAESVQTAVQDLRKAFDSTVPLT